VSILNRLRLNAHLDDAALAEIWTDSSLRNGQGAHPHLHACAACRSRYAAFTGWLEDVRSDAIAEADAAFPPERLATQHAQIFRRLEAAERPARVIRFPKFARPISSGSSRVHRWVVTSAAAGVIVGVALGQMMDLRHPAQTAPDAVTVRYSEPPRSDRQAAAVQTASATSNDAAFMAEIEASLTRPTVAELRAIDEFTPRAPFADDRR
jgi:hypothetical protein